MQHRAIEDLIRILSAGGGLELDATYRLTPELLRMAAAARTGGATLILRGMTHRPTSDLIQIASVSKGKVIFSA